MSQVQFGAVPPRPSARTSRRLPPHGHHDPEERYRAAFPGRMRRVAPKGVAPGGTASITLQRGEQAVENSVLPVDYQPLPLAVSDDSIDEIEEMLLSSTLNKLRSFGTTTSSHEQHARPQSDWYHTTRTDRTGAVHSPYDPSLTLSTLTDSRKLQSGPTRRGYTSLNTHTPAFASASSRIPSVPVDRKLEYDDTLDLPVQPELVWSHLFEASRQSVRHEPERARPSRSGAPGGDGSLRMELPTVHAGEVRAEPTTLDEGLIHEASRRPVVPPETPLPSCAPDPSPLSASSPSLTLTINTSLDSSGHRVLASRRRHSAPSSPVKCRKIKTAFGVGEDGPSLDGAQYDALRSVVNDGKRLDPVPKQQGVDPVESREQWRRGAEINSQNSLRSSRDQSHLSTRRLTRHVPIETFTPPPPLDAPSSGRLAALANLGRSGTHLSPVSSSSSYASSGSLSRRLSIGRRPTLKRFSLPNSPALPPLSPTFAPSRFMPVVDHADRSVSGGSLERNSSHGSASTSNSTSTLDMPATPLDTSPLLPGVETCGATDFGQNGEPRATLETRTPVVSFDVPTHALRKKSLGSTSYFDQQAIRSHRRAASAAAALEIGAQYDPRSLSYFERDDMPLTVTNPDRSDPAVSFAIVSSPVEIGLAF